MADNPKTPNPTDPHVRGQYVAIYRTAAQAADAFDGSWRSADRMLKSLTGLESYAQTIGLLNDKARQEFAAQAGIENPKTTYDLLADGISRVYNRMAQANSTNEVLAQLEQAGACVVRLPGVLVPTQAKPLAQATSPNPQSVEVEFQPRLAWLVAGLQGIGIYANNMILRVGTVADRMMRQKPYVVIELPDYDRQIIVCDQKGEMTFVSETIHPPETYQRFRKALLRSLPGMHRVHMTTPHANWLGRVLDIVHGKGTAAPAHHVDVHKIERARKDKPTPLSEAIIVQAAREWAKDNNDEYPTRHSGPITKGILKGNTWRAIDIALYGDKQKDGTIRGFRGLPGGSSLPDLLHRHGLKVNRYSDEHHLTEAMILQAALEWRKRHGEYPTAKSSDITEGILKGNTWTAINDALSGRKQKDGSIKVRRGLPGGSSLADLLHRHGLKANHYAAANERKRTAAGGGSAPPPP